jgi:hypothetical protein
MAQNDPAAFRLIRAIASADKSILRNDEVPIKAITHNMLSIRDLAQRMLDTSNATTDGTLATVALEVVYQVADFL